MPCFPPLKRIPAKFLPDELYDLEIDSSETRNCLHDPHFEEVVRELSLHLEEFFERHALESKNGLRMDLLAGLHDTSSWNIDPIRFPFIHQ